jgi:hypothetical protein
MTNSASLGLSSTSKISTILLSIALSPCSFIVNFKKRVNAVPTNC